MPDSDRGRLHQALAVVTIVFGVMAYWWMFYSAGLSSGRHEERARIERSQYAADTAERVQNECAGGPELAALKCVTEIVDAQRESQRNESDLAAQWKAADWVFWASLIAGAQLIATVIGLFYIKRTMDATWKAVEDTSKATLEMNYANEIARQGLEHSKKSARLLNRPYIGFSELKQTWMESGLATGLSLRIVLKNYGNRPATNVRFCSSTSMGKFAELPKLDWNEDDAQSSHNIFPGLTLESGGVRPTLGQVKELADAEMFIYFGMFIKYQDIFELDEVFETEIFGIVRVDYFEERPGGHFPIFDIMIIGDQNRMT